MKFYDAITEFIFVEDNPQKADIIMIPGGSYGEIAVKAAQLYRRGYAKTVLPSGKYSILDERFKGAVSPKKYREHVFETECDFLSKVLMDEGVNEKHIMEEKNATYTYENAIFSQKLVLSQGLAVNSAILCCQAYHARRCLLYYRLMFPDTHFYVCPAVTRGVDRDSWFQNTQGIDLVLNEVERCGSQFHEIMKKQLEKVL